MRRRNGRARPRGAPGGASGAAERSRRHAILFRIPADYAKRRKLEHQPEATRLQSIGRSADGATVRLAPKAARAWRSMRAAAKHDGLDLQAISGFRSVRRQTAIIRKKLRSGEKLSHILKWVAAPGYSEHHTGRAIDIGSPDEEPLAQAFARTREYGWLRRNASKFGFRLSYPRGNPHGFGYEPWHWFFAGWKRPKLRR